MADETNAAACPSTKSTKTAPSLAQRRKIPERTVFSVEYPGYVENTEKAIKSLGGNEKLAQDYTDVEGFPSELRLRPDDPTAHPIQGQMVPTNNFLIRVTRYTRKNKSGQEETSNAEGPQDIRKDKVEIIGKIDKTIRFRMLADFQYIPRASDPVIKFIKSTKNLDIEETKRFAASEAFNGKFDKMDLFVPPPVLVKSGWPQGYRYKQNPKSRRVMEQTSEDGTAVERMRIKPEKYKFSGVIIQHTAETIPQEPPQGVAESCKAISQEILDKCKSIFQEHSMLGRNVLESHFQGVRGKHTLRTVLPLFAYGISSGPWRGCWARYGYDPRENKESYKYQTIDMRHLERRDAPTRKAAAIRSSVIRSIKAKAQTNESTIHIYDEDAAKKARTGLFQLMFVKLPIVEKIANHSKSRRDKCDLNTGWLYRSVLLAIRNEIKHIRHCIDQDEPYDIDRDFDFEALDKQIDSEIKNEESMKEGGSNEGSVNNSDEDLQIGSSQALDMRVNRLMNELAKTYTGPEDNDDREAQDAPGNNNNNTDAAFDAVDFDDFDDFGIFGDDDEEDDQDDDE